MTLPCHISFAFFMLEALPESLLDLLVPVIWFYCKSRRIGHDVSNLNATSIWLRSFAGQCYVTDRSSIWRLESGQCVTVQQTAFFVKFVSTKSPHNKPYTRVLTRESSWFLKKILPSIACILSKRKGFWKKYLNQNFMQTFVHSTQNFEMDVI